MQTVIVKPEFWELFPEGQINLLALQDIDNHQSNDQEATFNKLLESATRMHNNLLRLTFLVKMK